MNKKILVVGAHPDDEVLGCGGTIARFCSEGHSVHSLFLTDGVGARGDAMLADVRLVALENASRILGVKSCQRLDFPDNALDSVPLLSIVKRIEQVIDEIGPSVVVTHHGHDLNIDHCRCYEAVLTACRFQPKYCVEQILAFETLSSTEWQSPTGARFTPNRFVDISEFIATKLDAVAAYAEEMRDAPHPRSPRTIEALSVYRGATVGVDYAEAFEVIREKV